MPKNKIDEIKKRAKLVDFVRDKVSGLQQRGNEWWACCPFHAERTPSFSIKEKQGGAVFYCHGCGTGGDIIRFIEKFDHCDTKSAIDKAARFAGMVRDDIDAAQAEVPPPPDPEWEENFSRVNNTFTNVGERKKTWLPIEKWHPFKKALLENKTAIDWLETARGISKQTADDLNLGYTQGCKGQIKEEFEDSRNKGWILYPRIVGARVVAVKMRSVHSKAFSQWVDMDPKALFNVETINSLEPVFVTEGELDTAIMEQAGFRAVSIQSASNHKLTPDMRNRLKQAAAVYLAGDNDGKVGNTAMQQLAVELGKGAYVLLWPDDCKDANDFFLKGCNRDTETFCRRVEGLMDTARKTPVIGFTAVYDQLLNTKEGTDARNDIDRLHFPWQPVDDMNYSPSGTVVVIYSTYSGTGKSVLTTQVATHEAKRGEVVVAYSPELAGKAYLALLAAQLVGSTRPEGLDRGGRIEYKDFVETAEKLKTTYAAQARAGGVIPEFYHPKAGDDEVAFYVGYKLPVSKTDEILDFIEYTIKATGATRFIIDTLHRIISMNGSEGSLAQVEGDVVKRLEKMAAAYGTIFVIIGQSNKEAENLKEARRDEYGVLRGSRELQDVAYAVYLLHRKRMDREDSSELLSLDAEILLRKDRGRGPGAAKVPLLYQKKSSTFVLRAVAQQGEAPPHSDDDNPESSLL